MGGCVVVGLFVFRFFLGAESNAFSCVIRDSIVAVVKTNREFLP